MIKFYWYLTGYIKKHGLKFLLVLGLGAAFFSLVVPQFFKIFIPKHTYYIGIVGQYTLQSLPEVIKQQISRSLVITNEDGTINADLAEKIDIEEGGLRYHVYLPADVFWQDGEPLVASQVNYPVRDARVTYEANEIIYDLPEVVASFPQLLTEPILRSDETQKWWFWRERHVYGLRPAHISSYKFADKGRRKLSQVVVDDPESGDRFVYRFYYMQDDAIDAFKIGAVDALWDVTNIDEIKNWDVTEVKEVPLANQYLAVFFDTSDPLLTRNVRQALSYAIEKERPGYERAASPIAKTSWASFEGAKKYDKNIDSGVERLLDEPGGAPLELTLITTTDYYDIASRIKEDWEALGVAAVAECKKSDKIEDKTMCDFMRIDVTIQIQSFPDTHHFQTLLIGQQVPVDPDQYDLWHSGLATNFTNYKNTRVDNYLERGRQTVVLSDRQTIYQEFQQALLEDPPAVFLWYLRTYYVSRVK